jgi:hypothetical protein
MGAERETGVIGPPIPSNSPPICANWSKHGPIAATDAQIDRLVYELYGLTEADRRRGNPKTRAERSGSAVIGSNCPRTWPCT